MARQPGDPIFDSPAKVIALYIVTFIVMVAIYMATTGGDSARSRVLTCLAIGVILVCAASYNVRRLSRGRERP